MSNPTLHKTRVKEVVYLCFIFAGLLFLLMVSIALIFRTWPDNRWSQAFALRDQKIRFAAEITRDRFESLNAGQTVILKWQTEGISEITAADRDVLVKAVAYARGLLASPGASPQSRTNVTSATATPGGAGAEATTFRDLEEARRAIDSARVVLMNRMKLIGAAREDYQTLNYLFRVTPDPLHGATLTPDEEAELADRITDAPKASHAQFLGSKDLDYFVLLAAFGAFGAIIQTFSSIGLYLGMSRFRTPWTMFYLLRPFVGAGVATALYLTLRAGMAPGFSMDVTNVYVVSALAVLVGLFSGQAMEKLKEIAGAVFKQHDEGTDSLAVRTRTPSIRRTQVDRVADPAASPPANLWQFEMFGRNFSQTSRVFIEGKQVEATEFRAGQEGADAQLIARVPETELKEGASAEVFVLNLEANGGVSQSLKVKVTP